MKFILNLTILFLIFYEAKCMTKVPSSSKNQNNNVKVSKTRSLNSKNKKIQKPNKQKPRMYLNNKAKIKKNIDKIVTGKKVTPYLMSNEIEDEDKDRKLITSSIPNTLVPLSTPVASQFTIPALNNQVNSQLLTLLQLQNQAQTSRTLQTTTTPSANPHMTQQALLGTALLGAGAYGVASAVNTMHDYEKYKRERKLNRRLVEQEVKQRQRRDKIIIDLSNEIQMLNNNVSDLFVLSSSSTADLLNIAHNKANQIKSIINNLPI